MRVSVETAVNLPQTAAEIEVFKNFLGGGDCSPEGLDLETLKKDFPVGTKVRVIGRENPELLGKSNASVPRIQVSPGNQGQLFDNAGKSGAPLTTAESVYDYRRSLTLYGTKFSIAENFVWLFEIRKDLKRLTEAKTPAERLAVLERLAYAYDNYEDYGNLLDRYLQDRKQIKRLLYLKKNWEKKRFL
ncbi:MAG: hypothetical protein JSS81_03880 [Acidobacteria bacterium]|nr:hypothetical protein [Acidobacteriota bacterium]